MICCEDVHFNFCCLITLVRQNIIFAEFAGWSQQPLHAKPQTCLSDFLPGTRNPFSDWRITPNNGVWTIVRAPVNTNKGFGHESAVFIQQNTQGMLCLNASTKQRFFISTYLLLHQPLYLNHPWLRSLRTIPATTSTTGLSGASGRSPLMA